MDISGVQKAQAEYDAEFWSHEPGFATIQHSFAHLGKLLGKVATYVEAAKHGEEPSKEQLIHEVIPDLQIFAARLANNEGQELGTLFVLRTEELRKRFTNASHPD